MKKSFIALALLSAFSGASFAQQSGVTIYGIADVGVQGISTGTGKTFKVQSGQENGSRLGFKGTEDLGNGLKANFVLEQGINIDTGSSAQGGATFGRRSLVGLSSADFGSVDLGRDKSPTFKMFDNFDPSVLASSTTAMACLASTSSVVQQLPHRLLLAFPVVATTIRSTTQHQTHWLASLPWLNTVSVKQQVTILQVVPLA